jgi:hypothetical protein
MGGKGSKEATAVTTPVAAETATSATVDGEELLKKVQREQMISDRNKALDKFQERVQQKGGNVPDLLRDGRYRIASQETTEQFYAQQPSSVRMDVAVPKQMEGMTPAELKKYLSDTEGLNIGKHKMTELSQQWRLLLASDAVQHGIDAGILLGTLNAGVAAAFRPAKRHPIILLNHFFAAYAVGVICFPMSILAYEQVYTQRIINQERDMFAQQRAEFYTRMKEATDARDPNKASA